jgi:hypothetical protein
MTDTSACRWRPRAERRQIPMVYIIEPDASAQVGVPSQRCSGSLPHARFHRLPSPVNPSALRARLQPRCGRTASYHDQRPCRR